MTRRHPDPSALLFDIEADLPGNHVQEGRLQADQEAQEGHVMRLGHHQLEPELKLALHAALAAEGLSLKEWLVKNAETFVSRHRQPTLQFDREPPAIRQKS